MARVQGNKRLVSVLLLATCLSACATEFERRYGEAEQLRTEAAEVGWEWIGTKSLLDQAREAAAAGDEAAALALVDKARFQAEAAIRQAEHEAEAWKGRVPR